MEAIGVGLIVYCMLQIAWGLGYWMGERDGRKAIQEQEREV